MKKIYTKTGDEGNTSLLGGTKVSKADKHIEAYGTVDELNSHVGVLKDYLGSDDENFEFLTTIQKQLFEIGSELSLDPSNPPGMDFDKINNADILSIEKEIDRLTDLLPELKNFILPGGNIASSYAHVCRTVSRRAERRVVELAQDVTLRDEVGVYLNRISDYFFTLARQILKHSGGEEQTWSSRK